MIRETVLAYRGLYGLLGGEFDTAAKGGMRWLDTSVFPRWPHLGDELHATAAAGDVAAEELAFVWCRSELLGAAGLYAQECTGAGRGGVVGQTWDWHPALTGTMSARSITSRGTRLVLLAEAGQPAKLGLNDAGVWIGLQWLAGSRSIVEHEDVPLHVAIRVVLEEADDVDDAVARLSALPMAQAAAFPVHGADGGVVVERHPGSPPAVLEAGDGAWTVHANHPTDPTVASAQGVDPWRQESEARAATLMRSLADASGEAGALMEAMVSVAYDADPSDAPADRIATLAAAVAVPAQGAVIVCQGRPALGTTATLHRIDGSVVDTCWGAGL